ncbi:oligosaccharide flippase family protein [Rubripirellula reticaptiva]|uniref:oligosaccharide flippase family protein n=1 Tax=Rubripirellula reticaptiva TaxID=2528013 RepID=UPI001644D932|nr:oligosaccharide flippase family protein [Rubripirellula reticaptiva]
MSDVSQKTDSESSFVADSLAIGMAVMLAMTVIQRGLGFFRGIWFCRLLDDAVVGQWSMAYDFITMITPVMLLGIPGTLPRYVEHYRVQGHLTPLVRRMLWVTIGLGTIFFVGIMLFPDFFGWLVFLQPQSMALVYSIGAGVVAIVIFNFVYQMVSALRQVRVASIMQFVQSVSFTVIGIAWLTFGGGLTGLVYAFIAATLIATVPGLHTLVRGWAGLPVSQDSFDALSMWRRLMPYAAALWAMNLLSNVFALSDRYMILHMMPGDDTATQAAVGQYHSGRIIPMLLISLATMISGVLMPYLAADWEAGRKEKVRENLRRILFAASGFFTAGAAVAMVMSPWFFEVILENRYAAGLQLMPMTFVFCIWVSLATIGQDYLWVAEKGKWVTVAIGVALIVNVALNYVLLPMLGLEGAVVATLVANGVMLGSLWLAMSRFGFRLDLTLLILSVLPATLLAGPWIGLACVVIACVGNVEIRGWCDEGATYLIQRLRPQPGSAA